MCSNSFLLLRFAFYHRDRVLLSTENGNLQHKAFTCAGGLDSDRSSLAVNWRCGRSSSWLKSKKKRKKDRLIFLGAAAVPITRNCCWRCWPSTASTPDSRLPFYHTHTPSMKVFDFFFSNIFLSQVNNMKFFITAMTKCKMFTLIHLLKAAQDTVATMAGPSVRTFLNI